MFVSPQRKDHINRQKVNQRSLKTATPKQEVISVFLKIPLFASFLFYFFVFSHPQLFNKPFLDYFRCMHQLPVCSSTFGLFISWHLTFHCDSKRNGMILNIILSFKNLPPPYNENVDVIFIFIGGDLTFWTYWSHTNVPQVAINVLC